MTMSLEQPVQQRMPPQLEAALAPLESPAFANILLVHDRAAHARDLGSVIHSLRSDLRCSVASNLFEVLRVLDEDGGFDVVIVDLHCLGLDGFAQVRARYPDFKLLAFEFPGCDVSAQTQFAELLADFSRPARSSRSVTAQPPMTAAGVAQGETQRLTRRELDVMCLIRDGLPNKSIANNLGITEGTVKVYARAIFRKLGVRNRTQAALSASTLLGAVELPEGDVFLRA